MYGCIDRTESFTVSVDREECLRTFIYIRTRIRQLLPFIDICKKSKFFNEIHIGVCQGFFVAKGETADFGFFSDFRIFSGFLDLENPEIQQQHSLVNEGISSRNFYRMQASRSLKNPKSISPNGCFL